MWDTISFWVHVNSLPEPIFTSNIACHEQSTIFTNSSFTTEPNTGMLSWGWYFDNDNLIDNTDWEPSHIFDSCGIDSYDVILYVEDSNGCSNYDTSKISISCPPSAAFIWDSVCKGEDNLFISLSDTGSFPINDYLWINSNGFYPTGDSINNTLNYIFNNTGPQNPTSLIVTDYLGCSDSTTNIAYVYTNPLMSIQQITSQCEGKPINFNSLSVNGSGQINQWFWDFGDGNTSTQENPIHIYIDTCLSFTTSLIVSDVNTCHDTYI